LVEVNAFDLQGMYSSSVSWNVTVSVRTVVNHFVQNLPFSDSSQDCPVVENRGSVIDPECLAVPETGKLLNQIFATAGPIGDAIAFSVTNITDQFSIIHDGRYKLSFHLDLNGGFELLQTTFLYGDASGKTTLGVGASIANLDTGNIWDSGTAVVDEHEFSCREIVPGFSACAGGGAGLFHLSYAVSSPWIDLSEGTYQWKVWLRLDVEAHAFGASTSTARYTTYPFVEKGFNSTSPILAVPPLASLSQVEVEDLCPDHAPPVSSMLLSGTEGENGWYRSPVTVTLSATDYPISTDCPNPYGVNSTFYRIDGGSWTNYSGSFTIGENGRHKLEFYSGDKAGNIEEAKSVDVLIDSSPPSGVLQINIGAAYTAIRSVSLVASATDGPQGSDGIQMIFRNSGGTHSDWMPYSTGLIPWSLISGEGDKVVCVQFRDAAGNIGAEYCGNIFLDTTPPSIPNPKAQVIAKNSTMTFSWAPSTDAGSGVAGYVWRIDAGNEIFTTATSINLPSLVGERHVFYLRAEDNAGLLSSWGSVPFGANAPSTPTSLLASMLSSSPPWIFIPGVFAAGLLGVIAYRKKIAGRLSKRS